MRAVCGRLEMRYRYSKDIVYNSFIWPEVNDAQKATVTAAAQTVLDARTKYPDSTLADLYDPLTMPPELSKAHTRLDTLVDKLYGRPFTSDADRVAHLFELYAQREVASSPLVKKLCRELCRKLCRAREITSTSTNAAPNGGRVFQPATFADRNVRTPLASHPPP